MMNITNAAEHKAALDAMTRLVEEDGDENLLLVLSRAVGEYEDLHVKIGSCDPVDCILFRMDQMGWTQKDVAHLFGGRSHTSEVLNRKRSLTKNMILRVHEFMGIPLEDLMETQKLAV